MAVYESTGSQESRSLSGFPLDVLTNEELVKLVENLRLDVKLLRLENEVLEKTIIRLDPALMNGVYAAFEYATKRHSTSSLGISSSVKIQASKFGLIESLLCPSKMFKSYSRISTRKVDSAGRICGSVVTGSGPKVNLNERLELVSIAMENLVIELNKCRTKGTKKQALAKAQLEEAGLRIIDIEEAKILFNEEVLVVGWDKITQRIPAEIWVRFMAEWAKKTDRQIGRLRLRTSTLNIQYRKLKEEVQNKAELREKLTPVDFDKIEIENAECLKLLENKLIQLEELKTMTGDANLNLTIHKKTMLFLNSYLAKVGKIKTRRELQTIQLNKETQAIQVQVNILADKIDEIKKVRMAYQVPKVVDYVNVKEEASQLSYAIKRLETRLHIKQTGLNTYNKKLRTLKSHGTLSNESFTLPIIQDKSIKYSLSDFFSE